MAKKGFRRASLAGVKAEKALFNQRAEWEQEQWRQEQWAQEPLRVGSFVQFDNFGPVNGIIISEGSIDAYSYGGEVTDDENLFVDKGTVFYSQAEDLTPVRNRTVYVSDPDAPEV